MTNLGFHRLMAERGIRVVTTDVGDRYVLEALRREGGVLGGEQSGHLIYLRDHSTGTGSRRRSCSAGRSPQRGETLAEAARVMPRWPQAKQNVRVRTKILPERSNARLRLRTSGSTARGRVLVRPSGTEPVVRVLAEAEREEDAARSLCYHGGPRRAGDRLR